MTVRVAVVVAARQANPLISWICHEYETDGAPGAFLAFHYGNAFFHAREMSNDLANSELTPADVPSFKEAWSRIEPFALTFDGFRYWGSVEKCAEVAQGKSPGSLTELRTCLFYEARRWNLAGKAPDTQSMRFIRALVYAIREKVDSGNTR